MDKYNLTTKIKKINITREKAAIIFMLIPCLISFMTFTKNINKSFLFFFNKTETITVSITPDLISSAFAFILIASIYIRNLSENFSKFTHWATFVLNIFFFASLLTVFVSGAPWNIPFINISSSAFVVIVIIFSCIGMKSLAGFSWIIILITSLTRFTEVNTALGVWGSIYIISAGISLLSQGNFSLIMSSLSEDFRFKARSIESDVNSAKNTTSKLVNQASGGKLNILNNDKEIINETITINNNDEKKERNDLFDK